ncbi:MAG: hypothetical protein OEY89_07010 [Gammaproteobacteria bacterium]|nr:hypothetical protein [Gammaproteobacteria bacterium]
MEKGLDFLKEEYFHLQSTVESFDERSLTVKSWSVTISMAGIGIAFIEKIPFLFLLAAASSLLFWIIETIWKTFQQAFYYRLTNIEKYLNGIKFDDFRYPYITSSWGKGWKSVSFIKVFFWPHVLLPHLIIIIAGITLWLINLNTPIIK